ncbi:MAG TPA: hypothetical protein VN634_11465 [Candidatus Limnocylindrales bacterium]|nr:hypothetical protein [Candidatus Limnocylindrales bacterium]
MVPIRGVTDDYTGEFMRGVRSSVACEASSVVPRTYWYSDFCGNFLLSIDTVGGVATNAPA